MKESLVKNCMTGLITLGIVMMLVGFYLALFTDIATTKGSDGILTIAGFIAGGLFLSLPAKIYLTLRHMKLKDDRARAARKNKNV